MLGNDLQEGAPPGVLTIHVMAGGLEHIKEEDEVVGPQTAISPRQHVIIHRLVNIRTESANHRYMLICNRHTNNLLQVFSHCLLFSSYKIDRVISLPCC